MYNFLDYLAERKHSLYHYLYQVFPHATTNEECLKRIEVKTKYTKIIEVIDYLPLEQKKIVDNRFDELKYNFS